MDLNPTTFLHPDDDCMRAALHYAFFTYLIGRTKPHVRKCDVDATRAACATHREIFRRPEGEPRPRRSLSLFDSLLRDITMLDELDKPCPPAFVTRKT
jgi:hypothetical protein